MGLRDLSAHFSQLHLQRFVPRFAFPHTLPKRHRTGAHGNQKRKRKHNDANGEVEVKPKQEVENIV